MVNHRKSGLWLSPGGHLEPGETLFDTLNRETEEELGVDQAFSGREKPFMLSISDITNPSQNCRTHFDVWYLFQNDGRDFQPDSREFKGTKWMSFDEARAVVTDSATLRALDIVEGSRN
jgi:8-oxo-dGTP diphosphatase